MIFWKDPALRQVICRGQQLREIEQFFCSVPKVFPVNKKGMWTNALSSGLGEVLD